MRFLIYPGLVALLTLPATGCVYINGERASFDDWQDEQRDNRAAISQLEVGMARADVVAKLGTPSDSEAFRDDDDEIRVLFYRTQRRHADGDTTRDETTPLVFRNDILVGWGHGVYAELRS